MTKTLTITLKDEDYELFKGYCEKHDLKLSGLLRHSAKMRVQNE